MSKARKNVIAECFDNIDPPKDGDAAIARIVEMVTQIILSEKAKFDLATFPKQDPVNTWATHWGEWAQKHFSEQNWADEWMNITVIATIQGLRAVELSNERFHPNGVTETDFIDAGIFAAKCCHRCYKDALGARACWCSDC